jgi:hypothetical protein
MPLNLRRWMPVKAEAGMATEVCCWFSLLLFLFWELGPDREGKRGVWGGEEKDGPMPFQQLDTGTGSPRVMARLDLAERKYGHVCVACSWPPASRSAKVS